MAPDGEFLALNVRYLGTYVLFQLCGKKNFDHLLLYVGIGNEPSRIF